MSPLKAKRPKSIMDRGNMRAKITVQHAPTRDGVGQQVWATFATARAEVESQEGHELPGQALTGTDTLIVFRLWRRLPGVKSSMRAVWGQRTFVITSVVLVDETKPVGLELYCREITTQ